jgi:cytolysin (calcineurin-like family phosphatase)
LAAILAAALLLNLKGCNRADDALLDPAAGSGRPLAGGTDVTFFVAADTHFGHPGIDRLNARQIAAMNELPETLLPAEIGGTVGRPRGLLIAGDLTERGRRSEWDEFVRQYGLTGSDGLLKFPVYEGSGNHDRHAFLFRPVLSGIRQRHGDLVYSWDWDDVHLVCLDLYPDAANLRWLRRDLARVGRRAPVVIFFHYPVLGPYSDWWTDDEKEAFGRAIDGYNVVGIFHGHFHRSQHYRWHGLDVYNVGSSRHGWHSFAAVHITDGRMTVASRRWDRGVWTWMHAKPINAAAVGDPQRDRPRVLRQESAHRAAGD